MFHALGFHHYHSQTEISNLVLAKKQDFCSQTSQCLRGSFEWGHLLEVKFKSPQKFEDENTFRLRGSGHQHVQYFFAIFKTSKSVKLLFIFSLSSQ